MREFFDTLGDYLASIRQAFLAYMFIVFGIGERITHEADDFWNDHLWVRVVVRTVFWGIPLLTIIGLTLMIIGVNALIDGQTTSGLSLLLWAMICNAIAGGLLSLVGRTLVFSGLLAWLLGDVLIATPANAIRDIGRYLVAAGSWVRQNTQGILRYIAAFNPEVTLPELNEAFTEFKAPETLPVFGPAQRRIRTIIRRCVRLVWAIERWFILNIGMSLILIFLFMLKNELPLPNLGSLFIAVSAIYLIFLLVWEKTKRRNFRPIAKIAGVIAVLGIVLLVLEYSLGVFTYLQNSGEHGQARKTIAKREEARVQTLLATYQEGVVDSTCAYLANGLTVVVDTASRKPIRLAKYFVNEEVRYLTNQKGEVITMTVNTQPFAFIVRKDDDGVVDPRTLCAVPLEKIRVQKPSF